MNKNIGLALLTAGIAITAGFGSNLAPAYKAELTKDGEAHFAGTRAEKKHKAYCKVRKKARLKPAEGCKNKKGKVIPVLKPKKLKDRSPLRQKKLIIKKLKSSKEDLPKDVAKRRKAWIKALKKERELMKKARDAGTQGPGARLSGWASLSAVGFSLGLILVIVGSVISRRAVRAELLEDAEDSEEGPVDFGAMLDDVLGRTRALHEEMVALEAPTETDLDAIKAKLEDIQKGDLARLCESGPKVQQRYGMAGFAEIFSPLSAGERKLNRLWATLVDRHWPEAMASAGGAVKDLEAAVQAVTTQTEA